MKIDYARSLWHKLLHGGYLLPEGDLSRSLKVAFPGTNPIHLVPLFLSFLGQVF